jgi:hypothetical protein
VAVGDALRRRLRAATRLFRRNFSALVRVERMAPRPIPFLFLVTFIIGTVSNKVTSLTTLEAGALSLCLALVGMLLATF